MTVRYAVRNDARASKGTDSQSATPRRSGVGFREAAFISDA